MSERTSIAWCDHTFNPWWGCTKVSPGCKNCYAETLAERYGHDVWGVGKPRRLMSDAYWRAPLKWDRDAAAAGRRARVFCASMADVFDEEAPMGEMIRLWDLIESTSHLDWLLLTKRPERIRMPLGQEWPNVWLGTSVEDQQRADERIPHLLVTPAAVRFLSCEPLIGPVDLTRPRVPALDTAELDWVIVGGESGHRHRSMDLSWMTSLVEQCRAADIPVFVKQDSGPRPGMQGRIPDDIWALKAWPSETTGGKR